MISFILFLIVLAVLVLAHEFGHFIVAKKSGIRVDEFGLGFGPSLLKFKKGETIYSINLLFFGGFVKIHGEEGKDSADPRSFASKPVGVRALVIANGVFFNLLLAWFLITIGYTIGMPGSLHSAFSGTKITEAKELETIILPLHESVWEGLKTTYKMTIIVFISISSFIYNAFKGLAEMDQVLGPIGIVGVTGAAAKLGFVYFLGFVALLSINLAVVNIIPFPALDGGRLLFLLIEKVKGSPMSLKFSNICHSVGLVILLIIMLAVTYKDVLRLIPNIHLL
jgi:regulator of sigma E protease